MIKAILFDLDGTLINTNTLILESFKYVLNNSLGVKVGDDELIRYFGEPLSYTMSKYCEEKTEELGNAYIEYCATIHDDYTEGYDGVEEALIELKNRGYKLAVVTSKRRNTALRGLRLFDLEKYFDVIVTPEDTTKHKPNPEPVLKALELLDVKSEEAIMIGDSHNDILSGKAANAKTCLVKYTFIPLEEVLKHEPDYAIDDMRELLNIL
ncbi:MAG TPA: pyrophosphatase PpaX [Clostridium sp.]|nr:pyrophosphatase PpaX [Clostridium sp.]